MNTPCYEQALLAIQSFGLDRDIGMQSLCSYAPVYRIQAPGHDLVLKRTGYPRSSANAIAAWLCELRRRNVNAVHPVEGFSPNPRKIGSTTEIWSWVLYPFIDGISYNRSVAHLDAAGRLLGDIHAAGSDTGMDLIRVSPTIKLKESKLNDNIARAREYIQTFCPENISTFSATLDECSRLSEDYGALLDDLPASASSWDFKASNIVFTSTQGAWLVDPDHGGRIPRIYDLACSLLLFHCDMIPSPSGLWNEHEWWQFRKAYLTRINVTNPERTAWPAALAIGWLDEVLWLLANFAEGWQRDGERRYLAALAAFDLDRFPLRVDK